MEIERGWEGECAHEVDGPSSNRPVSVVQLDVLSPFYEESHKDLNLAQDTFRCWICKVASPYPELAALDRVLVNQFARGCE